MWVLCFAKGVIVVNPLPLIKSGDSKLGPLVDEEWIGGDSSVLLPHVALSGCGQTTLRLHLRERKLYSRSPIQKFPASEMEVLSCLYYRCISPSIRRRTSLAESYVWFSVEASTSSRDSVPPCVSISEPP